MATQHVATIHVLQDDEGVLTVTADPDTNVPEVTLAAVMRAAADQILGRQNRAAGCWGAS